jgi:hypothetical protein
MRSSWLAFYAINIAGPDGQILQISIRIKRRSVLDYVVEHRADGAIECNLTF